MESMKDNTLAFSKFIQDSEKSHQSAVAQLNSELSKVRKEARRRFAFQKNFLEINARNLERDVIRKGHSSAQSVIDGILSSNSLPAVKLPICNVGADEEYPEPDSDFEFLSDDEKDQGDEEIQQEEEKSTNDAGIEIENPGSSAKV
ncbi:hypothetical protein C5167_040304 [Papaver somniferum]|uniref:Uncharacterized protein n=1 Tax=Papaver somniferum TaxID=3469 RepID=A0A4Y7IH07_PAPSO|nr:hypothetical protein C5167_040304 [Papaver somniferum]